MVRIATVEAEQFLYMVVYGRIDLFPVEINQVRIPLRVAYPCQQRCIRGELHHITVTFQRGHVDRLGQRVLQCASPRGIFAKVHFGPSTRITIVAMEVFQKPSPTFIIVLVYHRHSQLTGDFPPFFIVLPRFSRTCCPYDRDFRIFVLDGFVNHLETRFKLRGDMVFVPNAYILQVERFRMARRRTLAAPFRRGGTVAVFHQVKYVLDIL